MQNIYSSGFLHSEAMQTAEGPASPGYGDKNKNHFDFKID
jgi:hypothetical protein